MLMVVLKNEQFQRVRLDHWISFHDFVSPFSTIFSSSSARLEQIIKIRSPTNLKRHVGIAAWILHLSDQPGQICRGGRGVSTDLTSDPPSDTASTILI
jgi:hypothetical protein